MLLTEPLSRTTASLVAEGRISRTLWPGVWRITPHHLTTRLAAQHALEVSLAAFIFQENHDGS